MRNWRVHELAPKSVGYKPEIYGPNLGYIIVGDFMNHPTFRGLDGRGGHTSLVVKHYKNGKIETLNSRYQLIRPWVD